MSSDNVKENASVVDLSGVEWSHDTGNSDEPGYPNMFSCAVHVMCNVS